VQCVLAGLGRGKSIGVLAASQFAGAASFGFGGKKAQVFSGRQAAIILSMDELVEEFALPCPNYLKIDVPGLTDDILAGGERTVARPRCAKCMWGQRIVVQRPPGDRNAREKRPSPRPLDRARRLGPDLRQAGVIPRGQPPYISANGR
jgi:hypothetical protein